MILDEGRYVCEQILKFIKQQPGVKDGTCVSTWLYAAPLVHFLSGHVHPFSKIPVDVYHLKKEWWCFPGFEQRKNALKVYEWNKVRHIFNLELEIKSIEKVTFPCELGGKKCMLTTDVVDSDIPLLLGKPDMKAAKVVLDLENDQAVINGKQKKIILKLHKQFAHPSGQILKLLLHDDGVKECDDIMDTEQNVKFVENSFLQNPGRLFVVSNFNDVVAMDLNVFRDGS
ncbi:hypothetical protein LOTGIDRAFT_170627 [Lottia gigantea]|uniref:Uncharacterized protein n=1 Tax=Lottia gigantea TaxID=225164 RepID=V4BAU9_LOTGI|nr:hypothetical protein LOTGIDRAFT_170627 [Lottia gigantea]ESP04656.1 hypothetical protein LOTGIDRAFT_170627 [Lottia gigantea]